MRSVKELQEKHVRSTLDCFDRLYLNLYCPILSSLGGIATVIRYVLDWAVPVPAAFNPFRNEFIEMVNLFAEECGLEIYRFTNKDINSKEEIARQHLEDRPMAQSGVFFIGKAQEKVKAPQGSWKSRQDAPNTKWFQLRWAHLMVNQYYFYFWDEDWGVGFIKFSS